MEGLEGQAEIKAACERKFLAHWARPGEAEGKNMKCSTATREGVTHSSQLLWGHLLSTRQSVTCTQQWHCFCGKRRKCASVSVCFLLNVVLQNTENPES